MGKHDLKASKLQVEIIENKNPDQEFIEVRKKLRGSGSFVNNDPNDFAQMKDLEGFSGSISPWSEDPDNPGYGIPVLADSYRSYIVDETEYLFRSNLDDNTDIPSLNSESWLLIGLNPINYYLKDDVDNIIEVLQEQITGLETSLSLLNKGSLRINEEDSGTVTIDIDELIGTKLLMFSRSSPFEILTVGIDLIPEPVDLLGDQVVFDPEFGRITVAFAFGISELLTWISSTLSEGNSGNSYVEDDYIEDDYYE